MKSLSSSGLGALVLSATAADGPAASPPPSGPCETAITFPSYGGIVQQNPNPACVTVPGIDDVSVGGAVTGCCSGRCRSSTANTSSPTDGRSRAVGCRR